MSNLKPCKSCSKDISKSAKVCPNCGQKLKGGIGKILLIVFVGFIGLAILGSLADEGESDYTSNTNNSEPQKAQVAANPVFAKLSCGSLLGEVGENEARFVQKYKGKTVQITGLVKSVDSSFGTTIVNLSSGEEFDFNSCAVYPNNKKAQWPLSLNKGNQITVTCAKVQEVIGSVNLTKCVLN